MSNFSVAVTPRASERRGGVATGDTIPQLDLSDASTASRQLPSEIYGEPIDSIYLYNKAAHPLSDGGITMEEDIS